MTRAIDITGFRYGRLIVIDRGRKDGALCCMALCDCGSLAFVEQGQLVHGRTRSCGCLKRELRGQFNVKHGHARASAGGASKEFRAWVNIKYRCYTPSCADYPRYGGRGIGMCESWRTSFNAFLRDVGMAPSPAHSIDRIDNDRGYEPGNVRWATVREQGANRRSTRMIEHGGRVMCCADWAREIGITPSMLNKRLKRGWSVAQALGASE